MIITRISWIIMVLTTAVVSIYTANSIAFAFAVLLVAVPLTAVVKNLYVRRFIECSITSEQSVRKGDDGFISLKIKNNSILPVLRLKCVAEAVNQLNREKETIQVVTWVLPKKQQTVTLRYKNDFCGRTKITVKRILFYDCFGVIGVGKKYNKYCHIVVQPDTFDIAVSIGLAESNIDESEAYSQEKPGYDMTEIFQIREYAPGDSPKQIHWKLSSKLDKLIVKDPAFPVTRSVLVFWERTGQTNNSKRIDAQAETVISLCKGLIDSSVQFTVGWNDTDRNICLMYEIHDMDELVAVIPRLLRATGCTDGLSGAGLLVQTREDALCAHMVYVAENPQQEVEEMRKYGHVTTMLCGDVLLDGAIMFDEISYREQLTQIEI